MLKLNYKYFNNSKPLIVFIHGLHSDLNTWMSNVGDFLHDFDLLLVDQRGHGDSPAFGDDYSAKSMAFDLKELLDSLHIKKAHFLGHSMGGRTVMAFHQYFPEMCDSIIIEDMAIHKRKLSNTELDKEVRRKAQMVAVDSLDFFSKDEIIDLLNPYFPNAEDLMKSKIEEKENGIYHLKFWPSVALLYGHQGNTTDFTDSLIHSTVPMFFLVADFKVGSVLTQSCFNHIVNKLPQAKVIQISGAGHSIHKTHPKEFVEEVKKFISNIN